MMFMYFLCGAFEMKFIKDFRKGFWKNYGIFFVYIYGGMVLINYVLFYLNYVICIVFKFVKIIFVMVFFVLIVGKKYNWKEWLSAAIFVAGIVFFIFGDVVFFLVFVLIGVVFIVVVLCVDVICVNFEEKNFFRCEISSTT